MKILVTGGCGFIGSAVCRRIIRETGDSVVNLDLLTYAGSPTSVAEVAGSDRYAFVRADIADRAAMEAVFAEHQPDAVMNLAAESHVDRSIETAEPFVRTNVVGTFTVLETALAYWKALPADRKAAFRLLHISTDEVYGSLGDEGLFTETTPYDPRSPYSASKAASDHLVSAWGHTHGLPVLITNCSNNYGPYHFPEKLIPLVILNALAGKPLPVYGDGSNIRDWLYVEDHAAALLLVLVDVMKELPATLVLRPFDTDTLAVVAYQLARDERLGEAALPSLALVVVGLLPVILLSRTLRRAA